MVGSIRHAGAAAVLVVASLIATASPARATGQAAAAADPLDYVPAAPKAFDGIKVDEKLGTTIPLDLPFRDERGEPIVLGDLVRGDQPVVLTFNYSDCPMLCSYQLNALIAALPGMTLVAGRQFRIVTVVLNPDEDAARVSKTKASYVDRLPEKLQGPARKGWHFVTARTSGDETAIRALAAAVGFGYRYIPERAEYAHPAALILLSASGTVTRYVYGIDFPPADLDMSVIRAGTAEPSASVGFVLSCFHYDSDYNNYSRMGLSVLRYGAIGFLALMLGGFATWQLVRRHRRRPPSPPGVLPS